MNPSKDGRGEPSSEGESSRNRGECGDVPLDSCGGASCGGAPPQESMKRAAAKRLIERYFYQLVDGCGNPNCDNKDCASSGETKNLTPNEAAAEAIKLFYKDAKLCDRQTSLPTKVARTGASSSTVTEASQSESADRVCVNKENETEETNKSTTTTHTDHQSDAELPQTSQSTSSDDSSPPNNNGGAPLTEERVVSLCAECAERRCGRRLARALGDVFARPALLARSFPAPSRTTHSAQPTEETSHPAEGGRRWRDPDGDAGGAARAARPARPPLDLGACRRAFAKLAELPSQYYESALGAGVRLLAEGLARGLRARALSVEDAVDCLVIATESPALAGEAADAALAALSGAAAHLPLHGQARLARVWGAQCQQTLRHILVSLHQLITLRVVSTDYTFPTYVQDDDVIVAATKLMKIVYYASVVGGETEAGAGREAPVALPRDPLGDALDHIYPAKHSRQPPPDDPLGAELRVSALDSRRPLLPFDDFYNEPLCDAIEMDRDFSMYKSLISGLIKPFAFLHYPFILNVATKSLGLYYDNRIRMYSERRASILHAVLGAAPPAPYLRLKVRRDHLIEDALVELEMIAMERPMDLKKQLVVEFEGEQGVDEGGVSKEFFQLVVEQIFNPDYGMFIHQPDSNTVWFNPRSFEAEGQFTLIGIVVGLAIYNNVILAIAFPMLLYRKLLGRKASFRDLADWNPVLHRSLQQVLASAAPELRALELTFRISYEDMFGRALHHDLKPGGDSERVDQHNKQEFVDLYADFLLNSSVSAQFGAFRRGFAMVTDESPLPALFRPEELEMLVCGSKKFDFEELERSTEYEGGYGAGSRVVREFWSVAHALSGDDKRRLLQFATGSDRVPVGGLGHTRLVIARHGPDSDRLPTAHTCFNVLLLPEYATRDKLRDRLMKAITYSKGFGLL